MSAREDVDRVNQGILQGLRDGNVDKVMSHFAEDAFFLMPGGPAMRGADQIRAWWQGFVGPNFRDSRMQTLHVEERGDLVIEIGTIEMLPSAAVPQTLHGKYVVVHRREPSGELRYFIDIINFDSLPEGA